MKSFIDSFIHFLINSVIVITLLGLCIIAFVFVLSQIGNVPIENTISYVQSFKPENTSVVSALPNQEKSNVSINISGINGIDSNISTVQEINSFYYQQLDNSGKIIYNALYRNIDNLKKENYVISFGKQFNSLLNEANGQSKLNHSFQSALDAFFYDHPELFYIDLTKITLFMKYTTIGPITTYTVSLAPEKNGNYLISSFKTEEQVEEAIAQIENVKNTILNKLSYKDSDYDKVMKVHDTLVKMLEYNSSTDNIHNIYGALVEKRAVCEGYAKAFKYITDSLNMNCILVCGTATNSNGRSEAHMWNYIKLNGNWYGIDITWDDPIIIGGSNKNNLRHTYFCKGNTTFSKSHIPCGSISNKGQVFNLPTLASKDF